MAFLTIIRGFCAEVGWKHEELTDTAVKILFNMESGRAQTLFVLAFDDTLEFSVQSSLRFNSEEEIPHNISTDLMRKSCTNKVGMWVIEEIQGLFVYSLMHNTTVSELTAYRFESIVSALVSACDKFDGAIQDLAGSRGGSSSIGGEFGRGVVHGAGQKLGMLAVGVLLSILSSR